MRILGLSLLLTVACTEDTKIPTDTGPVGEDTDADTDADSDTDTDADTDADTDSDTDADTDTDTDADTDPPVEVDLTGRAYAVNLADAEITEPAGIGGILGSYLTQQILLGVVAADDTELQIIGAITVEDTTGQDYCLPTIAFPTADFSGNPDFAIGPTDISMSVSGYDLTISAFEVTGTFAEDGSSFEDGTVAGAIDTRAIDAAIGSDEGTICGYAGSFGAACVVCPGDGEEFCLTLRAEDVSGEEVGVGVVPVAGMNCEGCEDGPPADDAVCEG
ncbi:MAG: hypothetical protein ACK4YP_01400 [Myxococcota bacterium]